MRVQISSMTKEMVAKDTQLSEKEKEIGELQDCLSQVTDQTAQLATVCSDEKLTKGSSDVHTNTLIHDVQNILSELEVSHYFTPCMYMQRKSSSWFVCSRFI